MRFGKTTLLFFWALLAFSMPGCNAGLGGTLLAVFLKDHGGGKKKKARVAVLSVGQFLGAEQARTRPADSVLLVRLENRADQPANLSFEFSSGQEPFRPMTLKPPLPGALEAPGRLSAVAGSKEGIFHRVGWDALVDLKNDDFHRVNLRITGDLEAPIVAEVPVGNDPPRILDATLSQTEEGGPVRVDVVIADSSDDPADLELEFTTLPEGSAGREFDPATTIGPTAGLSTASGGKSHSFQWDSVQDLGRFDRQAFFRLLPFDRIAGEIGKRGTAVERPALLVNNRSPRVEILEEEVLTDSDQRRGISLRFLVEDAEGNPVDAIVQWAVDGAPFPSLGAELDHDPDARALLLESPAAQDLHAASLLDDVIEGLVEKPGPQNELGANEILLSSIKTSFELRGLAQDRPLAGRKVELFPLAGPVEARRVCEFDARRGVLSLDRPFNSPAEPGSIVRIDFGGEEGSLQLASSQEGVVHRLIWNGKEDVPGGGPVRFRITPFDRVTSQAEGGSCGLPAPPDAATSPGKRGKAAEMSGEKETRGPFLTEDALVLPIAPVDVPSALVQADMDADGRMDLAYAARSSSSTVLLLQTTAGSFDTLRLLDSRLKEPSSLVARDLDGDGDLDLGLTGEASGNVLLILQKPGKDFFTDRVILGAGAFEHPLAMAAEDLDGDGDLDLVVADAGGAGGTGAGVKVFFRGKAFGGVECGPLENGYRSCALVESSPAGTLRALAVAKRIGDQKAGVVAAGDGFFTVFSLSPTDNSTPGQALVFGVTRVDVPGSEFTAVAVADLNSDGRGDILLTDRAASRVLIARQGPSGGFELLPPLSSGVVRGPVAIAALDLNKDGLVDFAVACAGDPATLEGGNVSVFLGSSSGQYTSDRLERIPGVGKTAPLPQALAIADFDGDGRLDLGAVNSGSEDIAIFHQGGPGAFRGDAEVLAEGQAVPEPSSVLATDLDGDGEMDLIAPNGSTDDLTFFHQEGSAFLALLIPLPPSSSRRGPVAAASGDIDGDGLVDLVTANLESNDLTVLFQAGALEFRTREVRPPELEGPHSIALSDVDGDGRLDLVAAGRFSNDARWLRQAGDGSFSQEALLRPADGSGVLMEGPIFVGAADLDRDGKPDVFTANERSQNVTIFFQKDERGVFEAPLDLRLGQGIGPAALAAADLDSDGLIDLVTVNRGAIPVSIFRQTSRRVFASPEPPQAIPPDLSRQPTAVQARDLDGDGKLDLAVSFAGDGGSLLKVFYQGDDGSFPRPPMGLTSSFLSAPVSLLAVDLDGDGEADLVSANRLTKSVTVFYGGR